MSKLAIIDILNQPHYVLPIIKELSQNNVVFFYNRLGAEIYRPIITDIQQAGIECIEDDLNYSKARRHQIFYADAAKVGHARQNSQKASGHLMRSIMAQPIAAAGTELLRSLKNNGARFICYMHSVDDVPQPHSIYPDDFFIAPCESLFYKGLGTGVFLRGANGRPMAGRTEGGWEIAYAGPLHIDVEDESRAANTVSKKILQNQLAEKLSVNFYQQAPVISYFLNGLSDRASVTKGLISLSKSFNIVFKITSFSDLEWGGQELKEVRAHPTIFLNPHYKLNNPQRLAADLVLSDLNSSGAITSLFLGLRFILCHTERYLGPPYFDTLINYTRILRDPMDIKARLAYCLNPISIEATEMIVERFHDQQYWAQYDAELPRLKRAILGDHQIGKPALQKAVELIKRVLEKGTFWPETEVGSEIVKWPGRAYNPPIDLNL